jgi:predicted RNA-binding protein YlxR (DUF448 family)
MDLSKISLGSDGDVLVQTETSDFHRSVYNKGLLNTNNKLLAEYKQSREVRKNNKKKIQEYQNDINSLKNEVSEIKDSLKQILNVINSKG